MKMKIKDLAIGSRFKLLDYDQEEFLEQDLDKEQTIEPWDGESLGDTIWVLLEKYPKGLHCSGLGLIEQWKGPKDDPFRSRCCIVHNPENLQDYEVWCIDKDWGRNELIEKIKAHEKSTNDLPRRAEKTSRLMFNAGLGKALQEVIEFNPKN